MKIFLSYPRIISPVSCCMVGKCWLQFIEVNYLYRDWQQEGHPVTKVCPSHLVADSSMGLEVPYYAASGWVGAEILPCERILYSTLRYFELTFLPDS